MYRIIAIAFLFSVVTSVALGRSEFESVPATIADTQSTIVVLEEIVPSVTASAYAVIDIESGQVLFSENGHTALPIASVTKLFTAAMVLEEGELPTTITAGDVATEGRAGKLEVGQTTTTYELLYPLLLESSNDAAAAITRTHGLPQFNEVSLADGSGLSSQNTASAVATSYVLRQLYTELPHLFDITRLSQFIGTETGWVNNSPVRELPGYRGGKHGYTPAAGRTIASVFAEDSLANRELGYVLLGSDDVLSDIVTLRAAVTPALTVE